MNGAMPKQEPVRHDFSKIRSYMALPNLIDVAPAFDFNPSTAVTPEAPWMPILVAAGLVPALGALLVRRRRRVEVAEQR